MAFVMFRARLGDARDEEYLRQVGYALVDLGRLADEVPASSARADRAMSTPKERKIRALFLKELIGFFMRKLAKTNLRGKRVPVSNRQERGLVWLALANYGYNLTQYSQVVKPIFQVF